MTKEYSISADSHNVFFSGFIDLLRKEVITSNLDIVSLGSLYKIQVIDDQSPDFKKFIEGPGISLTYSND